MTTSVPPRTPSDALRVDGLDFRYGSGPLVLDHVSLAIGPGEVHGLVGPNGAGKSTLISCVVDQLEVPRRDAILVHGAAPGTVDAKRASIYLPSDSVLPDFLTGREYLTLLHRAYGVRDVSRAALAEMFAVYGMGGREDDLIEDYSHGMRKKVELVATVLLERPLTIIDETLNGVDLDAVRTYKRWLRTARSEGRSFLLCSHDLGLVQDVADRLTVLQDGRVLRTLDVAALDRDGGSLGGLVDDLLFGGR